MTYRYCVIGGLVLWLMVATSAALYYGTQWPLLMALLCGAVTSSIVALLGRMLATSVVARHSGYICGPALWYTVARSSLALSFETVVTSAVDLPSATALMSAWSLSGDCSGHIYGPALWSHLLAPRPIKTAQCCGPAQRQWLHLLWPSLVGNYLGACSSCLCDGPALQHSDHICFGTPDGPALGTTSTVALGVVLLCDT